MVPWLHMSLYASVWLNWYVICDDWVRDLHVIILVEMKPTYYGLKGNQGTIVTYTSICFSVIELMCYVWWLSYRLLCNHFGWNETSTLGVERKSMYHGYICTYKLQNGWNDMIIIMTEWWVHMKSFWLKWDQSTGDWKKIKIWWFQIDHCEVNRLGIEYKRLWLNDKLICILLES